MADEPTDNYKLTDQTVQLWLKKIIGCQLMLIDSLNPNITRKCPNVMDQVQLL